MTACASEPIPAGWVPWKGPVPASIVQTAMSIRDQVKKFTRGTIAQTMNYNGQTVGFFVSSHTWTWKNGQLLTGLCIPGVSVMTQVPNGGTGGTPPPNLNTPDPNLAMYGADEPINWPLVLGSAAAGGVVVGLFFLALRNAGKARRLKA